MVREQAQFLEVIDRDAAERRWWEALRPTPLGVEDVELAEALGRVLAADVVADVDVPGFDRSLVDGYALRAGSTFGATESAPRRLVLRSELITPGVVPRESLGPGEAMAIATGGMLPRGADAVIMTEHAWIDGDRLVVCRPVPAGAQIGYAGGDIARGELVLRRGTRLTARETGVLAAIGRRRVEVVRRPRVAIVSTGHELIAPGEPLRPGAIYDINSTLLADAVRELGGEPIRLGIVEDRLDALEQALTQGLATADLVLLSGGTSKGEGDVSYQALAGREPGIVVHGAALKPGKPICLGVVGRTPVAVLPGFPPSAIFTFHEFVAPLLRCLAGVGPERKESVEAELAMRCNSERGRTEFLLVSLMEPSEGGLLRAVPMGKGSGSVTTFSRADGFVTIPRQQEYIDAGETVRVTLLGRGLERADLVVVGSHCVGLDRLLSLLVERTGIQVKTLWVGSQGGLAAAARGECDLAGMHLLDAETGVYNEPFLPPGVRLATGYERMQGLVFRPGDPRFAGREVAEALAAALADSACLMVNRNRGSGTRILIDELLAGARPSGYSREVKSHHAVAAAVASRHADWGIAIETVVRLYGLGFIPIRAERFDFAIPEARWDRPAVSAFRSLLGDPASQRLLGELGLIVGEVPPRT
ncbi:MAG: molybdopterin biosynthesis protein [Isosphaeraceae bacterium]|jgi:putative molybdopterin biosynthesis protein|nr:MAG: molybdopterin biosynthesis protein [Isosphaeraceae bacterium]